VVIPLIINKKSKNTIKKDSVTINNALGMAIAKVKSILVTQSKPEAEKNPYSELAKKHKLKVDFRPFIHIEPVGTQEFRRHRVHIPDYTSVIFTSRNAVDHFFRIAAEMRIMVPEDLKYFCISESTAYYLQKYIVYRKRKVFHGKQSITDLIDIIKKHKDEKFLLPCADIANPEIPACLKLNKVSFTEAVFYKTVCSDLSDLAEVKYDILVFFSPAGVHSLFKNFPDFKQDKTRIAAFGPSTAKAVLDAKLNLDIQAPMPGIPSMTMAIEQYIKKAGK